MQIVSGSRVIGPAYNDIVAGETDSAPPPTTPFPNNGATGAAAAAGTAAPTAAVPETGATAAGCACAATTGGVALTIVKRIEVIASTRNRRMKKWSGEDIFASLAQRKRRAGPRGLKKMSLASE